MGSSGRRPAPVAGPLGYMPPARVVAGALRVRGALGRLHDRMLPPPVLLMEQLSGVLEPKLLAVLTELGVPDRLHHSPCHVDDLAREVGADQDALERALRFLIGRGIFKKLRDGRYANNGVTELLRADHPGSLRDWVLFIGSDWNGEIVNHIGHSVRTGGSGTEAAFGMPFFDYVQKENTEAGRLFDSAMASGSRLQVELLLRAYDFTGISSVCDVGGGTGTALAEVLRRHPQARGTLFDLPEVVDRAGAEIVDVAERCDVVGGDFFRKVPGGHDLYLLLAIVHDWADEPATAILANVRRAMGPGSRALVVDAVVPDHDRPDLSKQFDILMLVLTGSGRERTIAEFESVFAAAGLGITRDITLPNLFHAFEVAPA